MEHLASALIDSATLHTDRAVLRSDDVEMTYRQLLCRANELAVDLRRRGLRPGARVALVLPNVAAYAVAFYGAQLADLVVVPINPMCTAREIGYFIEDSSADLVFAYTAVADEVNQIKSSATVWICDDIGPVGVPVAEASAPIEVCRHADDTAVILYTSGTTGRPKGAELTHHNLLSNARTTAEYITEIDKHDVILGCLPLFHSFGLTCVLNAAISRGASVTLIPRFDPDRALAAMDRDGVTVFAGVPTMYSSLLNAMSDNTNLSNLRTCISGGAPLPGEILRLFEAKFGCVILEGYGLSETSPAASFNLPTTVRKPGTVGRALPGVEIKIINEHGVEVPDGTVGEIVIRGDNLMRGYWRRPEATTKAIPDTWFRSGDLGTRDDDGYFTIVDRKKDMIIRGGYNIYPREVEEVLYEHPDIVEAAVVGIPHPQLGEEVAAAVALRPGSTVTVEQIQAHVRGALAAYKYPRTIWIKDSLPKGPTGKILRRELRPQT